MTDKEKILQKIERLQKPTMDINHNFTSDYNQGFYDGLSQLELFIESLPKENKPIREYVSPEDSTLGKLLKEMKDFSPQEDLGLSNEEYNDFVNELIYGKEEPKVSVSPPVESNEVWNSETKTNVGEAMEELEEKIALYEKNHSATDTIANSLEISRHGNSHNGGNGDLEEAASQYPSIICHISPQWKSEVENVFKAGAQWQKENLWKDAQGDDLPEIDREVIVLYQPYPCEGNEYVVSFAHRPPERWYGRNLDGEEHVFETKTYDKGKWNIPNVIWWLDLDLPIKE